MTTDQAADSRANIILHITTPDMWAHAQQIGEYRAESLTREGFMHCSTPEQITATANRHYAGRRGLILLKIDPARVMSPLRYEAINTDQDYPHIYGALNLDAVIETIPLEPDASGMFQTPAI